MAHDVVTGVVIEIGVSRGVDVLAVYADRSARYESVAGAELVWDRPDESLDPQIDTLLQAAADAVGDTAPMDLSGAPAVRFAEARLMVLMSGETVRRCTGAASVTLVRSPRLGALLQHGSGLMRALSAPGGAAASGRIGAPTR